MKRLLYFSIALNILLLIFFASKKVLASYKLKQEAAAPSFADRWNAGRNSVQQQLPLDSSNIVFIGDSNTEGFAVTELFGNQVRNRGISLNSSSHVLSRIDDILRHQPKRIIVTIGVNDLREDRPVDSVLFTIKQIFLHTRALSPTTDIVFDALFPTRGDYFMVMPRIISFNRKLQTYCREQNITFVDMYSPLLRNNELDSNFTYDGIHLNGNGYKVWAEKIAPFTK